MIIVLNHITISVDEFYLYIGSGNSHVRFLSTPIAFLGLCTETVLHINLATSISSTSLELHIA